MIISERLGHWDVGFTLSTYVLPWRTCSTLAAYTSSESQQYEIYIRSFPDPGEPTIVSEGGGRVPFWSPDGNTLYYARGEGVGEVTFMAARLQRDPVPIVLSPDSLFTGTDPRSSRCPTPSPD